MSDNLTMGTRKHVGNLDYHRSNGDRPQTQLEGIK